MDDGNDFCWVLLIFYSVYTLRTAVFIQDWIYCTEGRNSTHLCYYLRVCLENYVLQCDIFGRLEIYGCFRGSCCHCHDGCLPFSDLHFLIVCLKYFTGVEPVWQHFCIRPWTNTLLNVCFHWNIKCRDLDYSLLYFRNWFILYLCNVMGGSACLPLGPRSQVQC